ncbi:MAG: hypothetical protein J6C15_08810 [Bacteroidaceae bacterium]|nr:hypothetical protein [Bacteroidaceae bacterium]
MTELRKKGILLLLLLTTIFTSCEEDYWFIDGDWRVVEISAYKGECPYYYGDIMTFYPDGEFYVQGNYGFYERGFWDIKGHYLYIDFNGDGYEDIRADVRQGDSDYMVLDVKDYSYHSQYTLRLVRF